MRKNLWVWVLGVVLVVLTVSPGSAFPPPPVCYTWVDLINYFVPNYPGWQTAKITWQGADGSTTFYRKLAYGPTQLELIKFNDPHSSETYNYDRDWIYITAENGINGSSDTRVYPAGYNTYYLGLNWMPRIACSSGVAFWQYNQFTPCYLNQVYYKNCNSCPCQYNYTNPQHCAKIPSVISFTNYNYGGSLGTIPTAIKDDRFDDWSGGEKYYYGLNRGFLRFEAYNAQGQVVSSSQQVAETANQPIADQACFHP
jgi:hypothetical protein